MIGKYKFKSLISGSFILVTILITILTITGYFGELHYILDLTVHFKVQYLVIALCTFFFFVLKRNKMWWIISLCCILLNFIEIVPWYLPQSAIANNTTIGQLRVLLSNIYFSNRNYPKVISLVRQENPDIAVFVEVNSVWAEELSALKDLLPYAVVDRDSGIFGTAIYSKFPLENVTFEEFQGSRKTIVSSIKYQEKNVVIMATHPNYPIKKETFIERNLHLSAMADYLEKINQPVILAGDFNVTMWSPFYQQFVEQTKLKNGRRGFGVQPTWPSFMPLLGIPIDHCFVSENIQVIQSRIGPYVGSDHFPIITDLAIGE
jgi:endonuclease/exonuclease/phosphatase (EEP) superfamily protein YafD